MYIFYWCALCLLPLMGFAAPHFDAFTNLEDNPQSFILKTQRICIPDHPHAFNPSIVKWNGCYLMSFREIVEVESGISPDVHCSAESRISLIFLDEEFNPLGPPQLLILNDLIISRTDDARLMVIEDRLYLIYSDNVDEYVTEGGYRVYVTELSFDGNAFSIEFQERQSRFQGEIPTRREKNWVPFEYEGSLFLIYSLSPHKVFYPLLGLELCVTVGNTWPKLSWEWGELRGGTPAVLVGDEYLSIFHSSLDIVTSHSDGNPALHYFIGAYTFSKEAPFEIIRMSPEPIVAPGFYNGEVYSPYWKPVRVIFPCGLISDGPFLWMAYGRQDHELWVAKIDRAGLLNSLSSPGEEYWNE